MIDGKEIKLTENKPFKELVRVTLIEVLIYEAPYELQNKHILHKLSNYRVLNGFLS